MYDAALLLVALFWIWGGVHSIMSPVQVLRVTQFPWTRLSPQGIRVVGGIVLWVGIVNLWYVLEKISLK